MPKLNSTTLWQNITYTAVAISNISIFGNGALAQITPDNTLGAESSTVNNNVSISGTQSDVIDGGAIRGTNLFHSFQEFNIGEGRGAYFTNPTGIESIFSRVTGGNASQVLGKVGVLGNADLFLINPHGIVFGSNATLDIKGSFLGSTASNINFADGVQFTAQNQTTPLLTFSVPIGLQFGLDPKSIQVLGNGQGLRKTPELIDTNSGLQVRPNKTLALVGGDLLLSGATIKTAGGQVALSSVDSNSEVGLVPVSKGWDLDHSSVSNFRDISLVNTAVIDVSGEGSGNIQLSAKTLTLQDGSQIEASTLGSSSGGAINIFTVESINLIGGSDDPNLSSGLTAAVYPEATGNGSSLTIETKELNLLDGAQIITGTFDAGSAGNLTIKANSIVLAGILPANNFVNSGIFTSVNPGATGNSGDLSIETKQLTMTDGAQIFTGTLGFGSAGNLRVKATESITLIGTSPLSNRFGSAISTAVNPGAIGEGGDLSIETKRLTIADGALVSSATFGSGKAGDISVVATDTIILSGTSTDGKNPSRLTTRTNGSTDAGNLTIQSERFIVKDGATVTASSAGTGNAGNLDINARSVQLTSLSSILTESNSGSGGDIDLKSQNLSLHNLSRISTTAGITGSGGDGGNITIDTGTLVTLDNSDITARAFEGNGGNIQISTQGLFSSSDSEIDASSRFGVDGVVQTQVLGFDVSNSLTPLKNDLVTPEQVLEGSCLTRRHFQQGSFVVTGSGGLPINPYSGIERWDEPENTTYQSSSSPNSSNQIEATPKKWQPGDPIVEAQTLIVTADGRGLLRTGQQAEVANSEALICKTEQTNG
jgi:filamentous hemagglutinin family protein